MKRSMMQTVFLLVFLLYPLCAGASVIQEKVYDICKYGAKGDGKTLNTNAINSAIEYCAENGGGTASSRAKIFFLWIQRLLSIYTLRCVLPGFMETFVTNTMSRSSSSSFFTFR